MKIHRTLLIMFAWLTSLMSSNAQLADRVAHDEVCEKIKERYNAGDYAALYKMLSAEFQEQLSLEATEKFFGASLRQTYGEFTAVTFAFADAETRVYEVQGEKGVCTLRLVVDGQGKIAGMIFRPGKPKVPAGQALRAEPRHDNPLKTATDKKVHEAVLEFYRKSKVPCLTVGVLEDWGTRIYNYGETSPGSGKLPSGETIYEIGSITKTFTALLLAQAVVEKKVALDADIRPLLGPGDWSHLAKKNQPIRLVQLANHTSGLPRLADDLDKQPHYDPQQPYANHDWKMISAFLERVSLNSEPGVHEEYSNLGAAVLGRLMQSVWGKPYDTLVEERICEPLKLADTLVGTRDPARMVSGYDEEGDETPAWELGDWAPAGGVRSTMKDMLVYLEAHLHPRDEAVRLALTKTTGQGREAAALGWQLTRLKNGDELTWHNGGTFGFSSFCGFVRNRDFGVVVLSNSGESVDGLAAKVLRK